VKYFIVHFYLRHLGDHIKKTEHRQQKCWST